jgi:CO/xanthine dehydrogenase FAD-binding subunit
VRSSVPDYELRTPASLAEALDLVAQGWRPFAGGTDLMVLFEAGKLPHRRFVNIWGLAELNGIHESPDSVTLGALTTYTAVRRSSVIQREFPLLVRAAEQTGGIATQNRGTLGGNIVNASPAADSPPALLVYDAEIELVSSRGARWRPYHGFHTSYKMMDLAPDELLRRIRLPRGSNGSRHYYRKVGTRKAQAISKVCLAALAHPIDGALRSVRVAIGSVAPIPLRCRQTENILEGSRLDAQLISTARETLAREIAPIDDIRSTANYRRRVAANLLEEFLHGLGNSR